MQASIVTFEIIICCILATCTVDGFSFHNVNKNEMQMNAADALSNPRGLSPASSLFDSNHMKREHINTRTHKQNNHIHVNTDMDMNMSSPLTSRRHLLSRTIPTLVTILGAKPLKASAKIDVTGLPVEGTATLVSPPPPKPVNPKNVIELAGIQYTPAAMILELAEQTASMEGMMRASAADLEGGTDTSTSTSTSTGDATKQPKSKKERIDAGARGEGPGVITRNDLSQSIGYMVKNSKAEKIAPFAAMTLNGISTYLINDSNKKNAKDDMTLEDYLTVAQKYERAREDLRVEFENMSLEEQQEGKTIVRAIRRRDQERMALQLGIRADK